MSASTLQKSRRQELLSLKGAATFTAEELEFYAEDELITIWPNFSCDVLHFLSGDFGPFVPGLSVQVPLWLAVNLKEKKKCRIEAPEWLSVDNLKIARDEEVHNQYFSASVPFHYAEIAHVLFNRAADNVPNADVARICIEDIQNLRASKLQKGMEELMLKESAAGLMTAVSHMEINRVRRILGTGMGKVWSLRRNHEAAQQRARAVAGTRGFASASASAASGPADSRRQRMLQAALRRQRARASDSADAGTDAPGVAAGEGATTAPAGADGDLGGDEEFGEAGRDGADSGTDDPFGDAQQGSAALAAGTGIVGYANAPSPGTVADQDDEGASSFPKLRQHRPTQ